MSGASPTTPSSPFGAADPLSALTAWVDAERARQLEVGDKSAPPIWLGRTVASFSEDPGNSDELPTPCLTLSRRALTSNVEGFAGWIGQHQVAHAPHGKTSMAPALWLEQLRAGAWAITVANETQLRVALAAGAPRVLVANLVLRPGALRWLAELIRRPGAAEVICWVDSVEAVALMDEALRDGALLDEALLDGALTDAARPGGAGRLKVLVELGTVRTGARTIDDAVRVAEAVHASEHLDLVGVGGYEGVAVSGVTPEDEETVRTFLHQMMELAEQVRPWVVGEQLVLTAGGSTWFDLVADVFGHSRDDTLVVVRSGSVVSHDDGVYRASTPTARGRTGPELVPALHLWARVLSRPEPGRVILDAGKRDLPFDSGLPVPQLAVTDGGFVALPGHELIGTNDQHATMAVPDDSPLAVGTVVRLGISHPCTAFDKWRLIPVLDDADRVDAHVVDWVRTWF